MKDYEYYRTDSGIIYYGDYQEIMPLIKTDINFILTDPPYNISNQGKCNLDKSGLSEVNYGFNQVDIEKFIISISNFMINSSIVLWYDKKEITSIWNLYEKNGIRPKQTYYWYKGTAGLNPRKNFNSTIESAVFGIKGKYKWNGGANKSNCFIEKKQELRYPPNNYHPTQKPISLFADLIKCLTDKNDLVLDCFFGSGTTGVACERLGRRWIGIEISEKYCKIAKQRIQNEYNQLKDMRLLS